MSALGNSGAGKECVFCCQVQLVSTNIDQLAVWKSR